MIPVRCWSCGKVIAHKYQEFKDSVNGLGGYDTSRTGEVLAEVGG